MPPNATAADGGGAESNAEGNYCDVGSDPLYHWSYEHANFFPCDINKDVADQDCIDAGIHLTGCAANYSNNGQSPGCFCYSYWGFECDGSVRVGPNITDETTATLCVAVPECTALHLVVILPAIGCSVLAIYWLVTALRTQIRRKRLVVKSAAFESLVLLMLACTMWFILGLLFFLETVAAPVMDPNFKFDVVYSKYIAGFLNVTFLPGILNIAAVWTEVVTSSKKMKAKDTSKQASPLTTLLAPPLQPLC